MAPCGPLSAHTVANDSCAETRQPVCDALTSLRRLGTSAGSAQPAAADLGILRPFIASQVWGQAGRGGITHGRVRSAQLGGANALAVGAVAMRREQAVELAWAVEQEVLSDFKEWMVQVREKAAGIGQRVGAVHPFPGRTECARHEALANLAEELSALVCGHLLLRPPGQAIRRAAQQRLSEDEVIAETRALQASLLACRYPPPAPPLSQPGVCVPRWVLLT